MYCVSNYPSKISDFNLNYIKILKEKFTMCYPYGDYTSDTVNILDKMKCSMALTVKVGAVPKNGYNHLELPRFDTNDFPKSP